MDKRMVSNAIKLTVISLPIMLAGCASTTPRDTFDLTASTVRTDTKTHHRNIQILVAVPTAVKALDGQDIVIGGSTASIEYLKGAQWGDRLPNLVQARFVQAFENTGQLAGVGRPGEGLAINYQVLSDIRTFGVQIMNGQRVAKVEIAVKIMDDRNGSIRSSHIFQAQQVVTGQGNNRYTDAINKAFEKVTIEMVGWALSIL